MIAHGSLAQHATLAAVGVAAVVAYAVVWARRPRAGQWPPVSWASGIAVFLLATAPPLERLADRSFTWHMAQHLVLGVVAAPLLVLARPGALAGEAVPSLRARHRAARRYAPGPVAAAGVAVAVMFVVHIGAVYDLALRHRLAHDAQHIAFVAAGALFWAGALGLRARSGPARLMAALVTAAGLTLLSVWILTLDAPLSDEYARIRGVERALDEQRTGAGLMWAGMIALTMPLLIVAVWRWAAAEQRAAERHEQLVADTVGATVSQRDSRS